MSDNLEKQTGENTREQVAYELLLQIASVENMRLQGAKVPTNAPQPDRKWILDTYAECLETVMNPQGRRA